MAAVTFKGAADVPHCSGMVRSGASSNVYVNGKRVSREDDRNTSHKRPPRKPPCPMHTAPIAGGSFTVKVNNKGCGRVGDALAGCTSVAEGSPNVFAGGRDAAFMEGGRYEVVES